MWSKGRFSNFVYVWVALGVLRMCVGSCSKLSEERFGAAVQMISKFKCEEVPVWSGLSHRAGAVGG